MKATEDRTPRRINQILSLAGLTSRREADEWIRNGRISVNDRTVTDLGTRAIWSVDRIKVDGREIPSPYQRLYLMLNKPFGYVSSLSDPEGRPIVTDLLKDVPARVYPVGRLDFDSMGLLLFTNDGEWTHRLTHPRYRVPRTYKVTVAGPVSEEALSPLKKGVRLEQGPLLKAKVTLIRRGEEQSLLRMTIAQGKTRQVRRMLDAVSYKVIHLIRIGFGHLELGSLKVGQYRYLKTEEIQVMNKLVGL